MAPSDFLIHYLPILLFLVIALGLSTVMIIASLLVGKHNPLLFIIFDLEIAFLFPWAISLCKIGIFGFWSMMSFLGVLTVGFIYEWKKGALDWE